VSIVIGDSAKSGDPVLFGLRFWWPLLDDDDHISCSRPAGPLRRRQEIDGASSVFRGLRQVRSSGFDGDIKIIRFSKENTPRRAKKI